MFKKNEEKRFYKVASPENLLKVIVKYYIKEKKFFNYRPDWLKNSMTGKNLELDIFIPSLALAVEVQGMHHKTIYQMKKDEIKRRVCIERGIKLIEIYDLKQVDQFIYKNLIPNSRIKFIPYFLKQKISSTKGFYKNVNKFNGKYFKRNRFILWKEVGVLKQLEEIEFNKKRMERRSLLRNH